MKMTISLVLAFVMLVVGVGTGYYLDTARSELSARAFVNSAATATRIPSSVIGKFQIVPGEYIYTSGNTGTPHHGVFRINTETGESELFREFVDDNGTLKLFWDKVE